MVPILSEVPNYLNFDSLDLSDEDSQVPEVLPAAYNTFSPRSLTLSIEDQANSFFFHHFVTQGAAPPTSYSSPLPMLFNQKSSWGSVKNPLPEIITAIGMAGISNLQSSPEGMLATRRKYTAVLRTLNAALQDPEKASADSTLMAVMLLGTFEVGFSIPKNQRLANQSQQVTCTAPQSLKSWANHVKGATAIAKVRGPNQVQTDIGRHILAHLRNQIVCRSSQPDLP